MQEYAFDMSGGLRMGLAPDPLLPNASDYALTMKNLRPESAWAGSGELFNDPTASSVSWPMPKLMRDEGVTLKLDGTAIGTVASNYLVTNQTVKLSTNQSSTQTITNTGKWDLAGFESETWFATNGVNLIFKLPTYSPVLLADGVTCATLCNNKDILYLCGLAGTWFSQTRFTKLLGIWRAKNRGFMSDQTAWSDKWVMYSRKADIDNPFLYTMLSVGAFGNATFDRFESEIHALIKNGDIGFVSTKTVGSPGASLGLGDGIRVYSTSCVTTITPADGEYRAEYDYGSNIKEFALSGDDREHAWISGDGQIGRAHV